MSGHTRASGPPTRLLLADGDLSLRRVLHLALQAHGYQVALADSANTALELAGHEHPTWSSWISAYPAWSTWSTRYAKPVRRPSCS